MSYTLKMGDNTNFLLALEASETTNEASETLKKSYITFPINIFPWIGIEIIHRHYIKTAKIINLLWRSYNLLYISHYVNQILKPPKHVFLLTWSLRNTHILYFLINITLLILMNFLWNHIGMSYKFKLNIISCIFQYMLL